MAAPFNYTVPVTDPLESAVSAYKTGAGIRSTGMAMRKAEQDERDAARARAASLQMQTDFGTLAGNKNATAQDYVAMMTKYPALAENLQKSWNVLDKAQKDEQLAHTSQVYAAINAGRNDIATDILTERATALRNSGKEDEAKAAETMVEFIKLSPESAKTSAGLMLAARMGPDKFAETFGKMETERRANEEQPARTEELQQKAIEQRAKAEQAATKAKFAESEIAMDLSKKGWDIAKIAADIDVAKENSRIAALNADIAKEGNQLKRDELKLKRDAIAMKRDEALRTKTAEVESARSSMDNFLNTADRITQTPMSVLKAALGPVDSRLPTLQQDVADFEALLETFDAQAFLSQVPTMKGMGALSNAEGAKLGAALQSFSLKQSPEQFVKNLKEAQRLIMKARDNLAKKTGVPASVPDTPDAVQDAGDVESLIDQYAPK